MRGQLSADQVQAVLAAIGTWVRERGGRCVMAPLNTLVVDLGGRALSVRVTQAGVRVRNEAQEFEWVRVPITPGTIGSELQWLLDDQDRRAAAALARVLE